jgi:HlyD family secretion protein
MRKVLFVLSFAGLLVGCLVAYLSGITPPEQPPVFSPASNPYPSGIYANGIVESDQPSGENTNVFPEVSGTVKQIFVTEGQAVRKGTPLLMIDESVQRATAEQQLAQAQAAHALLDELRAQPRKENLDVARAQADAAEATLKTTQDARIKQENAYERNPRSISRDALDSARNAVSVAKANLLVAQKQLDLVRAGAWSYDVRNQEQQYNALRKAYAASNALLSKYTLRAPRDGVVLSITSAVGSFVSPQGGYESYTGGQNPVLILGSSPVSLNVRCYVDEILVSRLPSGAAMKAQMTVRGSGVRVPLTFVRVQPFISPKIELSNQRTERVDVRVLPVIFRIDKPNDLKIYPGELVDVYISQ